MTFLRTLIFATVLMPGLALFAQAQETGPAFPDPISDTVSDFAEALNATEEGRISRILAETRDKTGVHLVIVTAAGLDGLNGGGMRLEDFGKALFDAWGIGGKKRNDGILVLIDTEAREARITLGAGYPAVYDDRAARVLSTALLPLLREGRMAPAVEATILSVRDQLMIPFLAGALITATEGFDETGSGLVQRIGIGLLGVFGFLGISFWRRARARKICPKCHAPTLKRETEVIMVPTKFQEGLGLEHRTCTSCGFVDRHSYAIACLPQESRQNRDDRFGSAPTADPETRDEGGFDGGKSDGGGAGKKW